MASQHRKLSLLWVIQPMHSRTDRVLHRRIENAINVSWQITLRQGLLNSGNLLCIGKISWYGKCLRAKKLEYYQF